ncbi:MAG: hypothetical protein ABII07_04390 [Patescibacteria group bacterium]|nr:hypothetical protein [Patescibacteria group bacterium]
MNKPTIEIPEDWNDWHDLEKAEFLTKTLIESREHNRKCGIEWLAKQLDMCKKTLQTYLKALKLPPVAQDALAANQVTRHGLSILFSRREIPDNLWENIPPELRTEVAFFRQRIFSLPIGSSHFPEHDLRKNTKSPEPKSEPPKQEEIILTRTPEEIFVDPKSPKEERIAAFKSLTPLERIKLCAKICEEIHETRGGNLELAKNEASKILGIRPMTIQYYKNLKPHIERNPTLLDGLDASSTHTKVIKTVNKRLRKQEKAQARKKLIHQNRMTALFESDDELPESALRALAAIKNME